ncbi:MAG: hypothetical protein ACR2JP_07345 [Acidimicrobiia bacterium]
MTHPATVSSPSAESDGPSPSMLLFSLASLMIIIAAAAAFSAFSGGTTGSAADSVAAQWGADMRALSEARLATEGAGTDSSFDVAERLRFQALAPITDNSFDVAEQIHLASLVPTVDNSFEVAERLRFQALAATIDISHDVAELNRMLAVTPADRPAASRTAPGASSYR